MILSSPEISRHRPKHQRRLAALLMVASAAALIPGSWQVLESLWRMPPGWSLLCVYLGSAGLLGGMLWYWNVLPPLGRRSGIEGSLQFGDEGLALRRGGRAWQVAYHAIEGVWFEQEGTELDGVDSLGYREWLVVRTCAQEEIGILVPAKEAPALRDEVRYLRLDARTVTMTLGSRTRLMRWIYAFCLLLCGALGITFTALLPYQIIWGELHRPHAPTLHQSLMRGLITVLIAALGVACLWGVRSLLRILNGDRVTIGTDGIALKRSFARRWFVPLDQLEPVDYSGGSVVLRTAGGDRLPVGLVAGHAASHALGQRIEMAQSLRREALSQIDLSVLDRRERDSATWRADLLALSQQQASYRSKSPLQPEQLLEVAEDATAAPERRVAATLALSQVQDEQIHSRLRIAAQGCANQPLQRALCDALDGELADRALRAATEAHERVD